MTTPLSIRGYDIDPVTRRPVHLEAEEAMNRASNEKIALANDLLGEGGKLVSEISRLFIARIEALIANDPECQAYEKVFKSIDYKLNAGERVVAKRYQFQR